MKITLLLKTTSFQVKVLKKKFTLLHSDFPKIVLKYSNEVHLLRYLTPLRKWDAHYTLRYFGHMHLGYATKLRAPQSIELIRHLERTQWRTTKYILSVPLSSSTDYTTRLQTLVLLSICYWQEYLDITEKISKIYRRSEWKLYGPSDYPHFQIHQTLRQ
jgi:hypothetical protein